MNITNEELVNTILEKAYPDGKYDVKVKSCLTDLAAEKDFQYFKEMESLKHKIDYIKGTFSDILDTIAEVYDGKKVSELAKQMIKDIEAY